MFLPTAIYNPFILGISLMGGPDVLDGDLNPQADWDWIPIECEVSQLQIGIGGSVESNTFFQPDSGSMSLTMQSHTFDPSFNSSIRAGAKIRIRLFADLVNEILFSGFVDSISVGYYSEGAEPNVISIKAFDSYKRLVNARLANFDTTGLPAAFATPLQQITEAATEAGFIVSASSDALDGKMPKVADSDTIASGFINDAIQVGLGLIWIDQATGEVKVKKRPDTISAPVGTYTIGNNHGSPYHLCMSDIGLSGNSDSIYNSLKVSLESNPATYVVVIDEGSIALYGETSNDIVLNTTDSTELTRWANEVFTTAPTKLVDFVETPAIDREGNLTEAALFYPGNPVKIYYARNGDVINATYVVTKVSHSIDVNNWFTTLELWRGQ